ncbi:MAG: AEC family transporter [Cyanobacterium sp. T60_A2020_053]|nr:AEC family transporter [Cyanobacterium sp. T60_A2020_053]
MVVILSAVLPVAVIILVGYIAGQKLNLDTVTLCELSVYIFAPAIVADSLYRTTVSGNSIFLIIFNYTIISAILYFLIVIFSKIFHIKQKNKQSFFAIILSPNNGNMGLPIVTFALGNGGLERAVIYMIASSIFLFGMLPAILSNQSFKKSIKLTLGLPLVWAMLGGALLNFLSIQLPFNLGKSLELLGIAAIPTALIILGMQLSQSKFEFNLEVSLLAGIKLIFAPLIAYFVGGLTGLSGLDLQVLILQTAMPTAVNSLVMVKQFGGNDVLVAQTIIISTVMSFISLPIIIGLIN